MQSVTDLNRKKNGVTLGDGVTLDLMRLVDTRMLIQANSGGGKSWLLRLLAEEVAGQMQTIILDPEGEFATLRERVDMLLVSREGEIPADTRSAALLARKLAELGVSAVIDLYDLKLHERRHYVKLFLDSLMSVPRSLWHPLLIVIDECHVFAPERTAGDSEALPSIISLMSQGRKRGFCGVISTQRLSKLHKDVAAEANNIFIGRTWLDVDQQRAGDLLGMTKADRGALRDLAPGEFFAFGPALPFNGVMKFQAGKVATTHPKAGERHKITPPKASNVIRQIVEHLSDLPQQAEAEIRDLNDARLKIVSLERELRSRPVQQDERAVTRAVTEAVQRVERDYQSSVIALQKENANLISRLKQIAALSHLTETEKPQAPIVAMSQPEKREAKPPVRKPSPPARTSRSGAQLKAGERIMLQVLAQFDHLGGLTRDQLALLSGYTRSGTFDTYVGTLIREQLASRSASGRLSIADAGRDYLGADALQPPKTTAELQVLFASKLKQGERVMLEILISIYPHTISRDELASRSGYTRSGTFDTYVGTLTRNHLAVKEGGALRASDTLFLK